MDGDWTLQYKHPAAAVLNYEKSNIGRISQGIAVQKNYGQQVLQAATV